MTPEEEAAAVGQEAAAIIKARMAEWDIQQGEFAERMGVTQGRVSLLLGQRHRNLTLQTLAKMGQAVGLRLRLEYEEQ